MQGVGPGGGPIFKAFCAKVGDAIVAVAVKAMMAILLDSFITCSSHYCLHSVQPGNLRRPIVTPQNNLVWKQTPDNQVITPIYKLVFYWQFINDAGDRGDASQK